MSRRLDYGVIRSRIAVTVSVLLQHTFDSSGVCSGYTKLLIAPFVDLVCYVRHCQRTPQDSVKMLLVGAIHGGVTLLRQLCNLLPHPGNLLLQCVPGVQCPRDRIRSPYCVRDCVRVNGYKHPLPAQ